MKIQSFILPVVALAIVGAWVASQRQSIASIEEQSLVLRKKIASVRASGSSGPALAGRSSPGKQADKNQPLDWKIAADMAKMWQQAEGMGDSRAMMRLQQRIENMTSAELVAALGEIATLGLAPESQVMLERMLVGPLLEKDPELALTHFIDRMADGLTNLNDLSWKLSGGFAEWIRKDSAKAGAWFDQQIADGKFDSKSLENWNYHNSQVRNDLEGAMVSALLDSDPQAAARRLATLPEDQRSAILDTYAFEQSLNEDSQLEYADLVRNVLPESEHGPLIANLARQMVADGGFAKVDAYLDQINATPAERKHTVEVVATGNFTYESAVIRKEIDSMREWVSAQSPESVDGVTAQSLVDGVNNYNMKFSDAVELAQEYRSAGGGDEVLASVLGAAKSAANIQEARVLAEKITDPKLREQVLDSLRFR